MKKKGFTLVELLAVIAILAILVIIALPNVMGMFNTAKYNSFLTEVKQIYKVAEQSWIGDSMFNTSEQEYGRCDGCSYKELDLTGRQELKYYIKIDKSGCVTKYTADDGTYRFNYNGSCLKITDITDDYASTSDGGSVDNNSYVYFYNNGKAFHIGDPIATGNGTIYGYSETSAQDVINATNQNILFRFTMDNNNKIKTIEVGINYNGQLAYFKALPEAPYEYNKSIASSIFPAGYCTELSDKYDCRDNDNMTFATIYKNNKIYLQRNYSFTFTGTTSSTGQEYIAIEYD